MAQHHKYSITEIENMLPFERDLYTNMIIEYLESRNKKTTSADIINDDYYTKANL